MSRLKIFAKGNLDVHDSLHSLGRGSNVQWNGINEILRDRHSRHHALVRHETWVRSDALLEATGKIPDELLARNLPLQPHGAASQFSRALFNTDADVIVLSLQPDLQVIPLRHRRHGYLLFPQNLKSWSPENRDWLHSDFVAEDILGVDASMANFARIIGLVRAHTNAPILVYNVSSIVPGDTVHAYDGMEETFATRIRRFNLGLIELSRDTGVSIIDVDAVVARQGANVLKFDTTHLNGQGCRAVAGEVVRVLADLGCLS